MSQTLQAISSDAGDNSESIRTFLGASGVDGTHGLRPCRKLSFFSQSPSIRTVMGIDPDALMVSQEWTTPSGTPLGGWGNLILRKDGTGEWHLHAHVSGNTFYHVSLTGTFTTPSGLQISCTSKLYVDITSYPDAESFAAVDPASQIAKNWVDYRMGRFEVTHEYDNTSSASAVSSGDNTYVPNIGGSD